jgi:hypothetical protein
MELHLQVIWVALLLALAIDHHGELLVWTEEQVFKLRCMYGRQHLCTRERKVSFDQLLTDRGDEEGGNGGGGVVVYAPETMKSS